MRRDGWRSSDSCALQPVLDEEFGPTETSLRALRYLPGTLRRSQAGMEDPRDKEALGPLSHTWTKPCRWPSELRVSPVAQVDRRTFCSLRYRRDVPLHSSSPEVSCTVSEWQILRWCACDAEVTSTSMLPRTGLNDVYAARAPVVGTPKARSSLSELLPSLVWSAV